MALTLARRSVFLADKIRVSSRILKRAPCQGVRSVSASCPQLNKKEYEVTFVRADGTKVIGRGKEGDSLLDVVVNCDLDFDGYGACEGTLTCSTCHVILKQEDYDRLPDKPSEEENDMLDLAFGLCETIPFSLHCGSQAFPSFTVSKDDSNASLERHTHEKLQRRNVF